MGRAQKGTEHRAIGGDRGGLTTKILALVEALGHLVRFRLLPGQRGETTQVAGMIEGLSFGAFLGDKAYDADWLRDTLQERGIKAVIPARAGRLEPAPHDAEKYEWRHLVENFFQKLKEFRRVTMRSCKTDESFAAMIQIVAVMIQTR